MTESCLLQDYTICVPPLFCKEANAQHFSIIFLRTKNLESELTVEKVEGVWVYCQIDFKHTIFETASPLSVKQKLLEWMT